MSVPFPSLLTYPLAATLGLSLLPWGKYALYPFRLFTTWVHECCHAMAALLLGGRIRSVTLSPDTSGVTHFSLPVGRIRHALVASAGYLGSSIVGCTLYALSLSWHRSARELVLGVGILMGLSLLFWVRNLFGALAVCSLSAALIALSYLAKPHWTELVLVFLAIQTALNALFDIRMLFSLDSRSRSDAHTMQKLFYLPATFWAITWLSTSCGLMYFTIRKV